MIESDTKRLCNAEYFSCDLKCADRKFCCENERRRRIVAAQIKNNQYQASLPKPYNPDDFSFRKSLKNPTEFLRYNQLSLKYGQKKPTLISGKGYLYKLPNGKKVYTLFFVVGAAKEALLRDQKCLHCGTIELLTRDHIHPKSLGGKLVLENIQILCLFCNGKKADKI